MSFLSTLNESHKKSFILNLLALMESNLEDILKSAQAAHGGATHEDAVAKSKYDTHGLELSYLAGSQYERAELLQNEIQALKALPIKKADNNDSIAHGCLIELTTQQNVKIIFLSPFGAGLSPQFMEKNISVVSPQSPLGSEILDSYLGDEVPIKGQVFEITGLL